VNGQCEAPLRCGVGMRRREDDEGGEKRREKKEEEGSPFNQARR
jgi:hypothetical protein